MSSLLPVAYCLLPSLRFSLLPVASCLLPAIASCLLPFATAHAASISEVRLGFPDGPHDRYKVGSWAPVRVKIESPGGLFNGQLIVSTPDSDGVWARSHPLDIQFDGTTYDVSTYVKVGGHITAIRVYLTGSLDGKKIDQIVRYEPQQRTQGLPAGDDLILCLGRPKGFDSLKKQQESGSNAAFPAWQVSFVDDVALLPDRWFGYDAIDHLILPTGDLSLIEALKNSPQKLEAFLEWIRMGGHLIVSVQSNHAFIGDAARFPLEPILPAVVDKEETYPLGRLRSIESMIARNIEGYTAPAFAGIERNEYGDLKPLQLARLHHPSRHAARSVAFEQHPEGFVIVDGPHGLGRITLLAFDTDTGRFVAWEGNSRFWPALLQLRNRETSQSASLSLDLNQQDMDMTTRFLNRLEDFPETPVVSFGWIAVLMLGFIAVVGPLDYFFVKKLVKYPELTWITLPAIVAGSCVLLYLAADRYKGDQLRINKVDVVDLDVTTQQVYGRTWFTVYSPAHQQFDIAIEPDGLIGPAAKSLVSWMGRPGTGMRGLSRNQAATLFRRSYRYSTENGPLEDVPISVSSVKSFTGRWHGPAEKPVLVINRLVTGRTFGSSLIGLSADFPWKLERCQLYYKDEGWELGALLPAQPVRLPTDAVTLPILLSTSYSHTENIMGDLMSTFLFHGGFPRREQRRNEHLRYLDQSRRLGRDGSEAILIGRLPPQSGSLNELNENGALGCKLRPLAENMETEIKQQTLVRIFLPVAEP